MSQRTDPAGADGTFMFFAGACTLTWLLAVPVAWAQMQHRAPPPSAVGCAGLSALGPLIAAWTMAWRRRQLRVVFGRWRTNVAWIVIALFVPAAVHALGNVLCVALGGHLDRWFYPPSTPEQLAALVVFPLGEEFGWRGFAHPRLVHRHGLVKGSLMLGFGWGLWHLMYSINSSTGTFDGLGLALLVVEVSLFSVLIGWVFDRSGRSMAVALAFHVGAHLDNFQRAPRGDLRLQGAYLAVLALATVGIALITRAAARSAKAPTPSASPPKTAR
jgi:membrane protease YdiL (CAAX protease family)